MIEPTITTTGEIPAIRLHGTALVGILLRLTRPGQSPDPRDLARAIQIVETLGEGLPVEITVHLGLVRVSGQVIWPTAEEDADCQRMIAQLHAVDAGGWTWPADVSMSEARAHFTAFAEGEILPLSPNCPTLLPRRRIPEEGGAPRGARAIWAFAQAIAETSTLLSKKEIDLRRARRVIAILRTAHRVEGDLFPALMLGSKPQATPSQRAVEAAALTIQFTEAIGLPEPAINDLALTALLHLSGVPWLDEIPSALFETAEVLHTLALAQLWSEGKWSAPLMRRVITAVEHALGPAGRGPPRLGGAPAALPASRLLALICLWLELVQGSAYAEPVTPFEAGLTLLRRPPAHLGAALVTTFVAAIGLMPTGSMVALAGQHIGVITAVEGAPLGSTPRKTTVRLISAIEGTAQGEITVEGLWPDTAPRLHSLILGPDRLRWMGLIPDREALSAALTGVEGQRPWFSS